MTRVTFGVFSLVFGFGMGAQVAACSSKSGSSSGYDAGSVSITCVEDSAGNCECDSNGASPLVTDGKSVASCTASSAASAGGVTSALCCADMSWPPMATYDVSSCTCFAYVCTQSTSGTCSCGFEGVAAGDTVKSCTAPAGGHYCVTEDTCYAGSDPCDASSDQTEVSDCSGPSILAAKPSELCPASEGIEQVRTCGSATSSGGSGSDAGSGGGSGGTCKSAGPGTCGDTAALNHCNCGAGCYRDSAATGSGYSCHITCTTDADCTNVYDHATTCQPFTADTGTPLSECR